MTKKRKNTAEPLPMRKLSSHRWAIWLALALVVISVAAIRIRLLDFPLERDEGEYAYAGKLLLQGVPPYGLAYNMKLPGTYAAYAGIMAVFGQSIRGIHLGLTLLNAATILLVFLLGRRVANERVGVVAAATFGFLSLSPGLLGLAGHATHFVLLPAVAGLLLLLYALENEKKAALFGAGFLLGLAFLMKQQGIFFGIFGGCYVLYHALRTRPVPWRKAISDAGVYSLGAVLPFAATCLALYCAGVFDRFWFWTFTYAREYAVSMPLSLGWRIFLENFTNYTQATVLLWILAGLGLVELAFRWRQWPKNSFIVFFLLFSFLAVCPGFYFRNHYFILVLPAVGILAGLAINRLWLLLECITPVLRWASMLIFTVLVAIGVYKERLILLRLPPAEACIATYGANPFTESMAIAQYIKENSSPDDKVAILGSEPQICLYADRRLASGYLYTYALMEPQPYALQMQKDMIKEIEEATPEFVVFVNIPTSWLPRPDSHSLIFEWFDQYAAQHLEQVGYVDFISNAERTYHLGDWEGKYARPTSNYSISLYKRKAILLN